MLRSPVAWVSLVVVGATTGANGCQQEMSGGAVDCANLAGKLRAGCAAANATTPSLVDLLDRCRAAEGELEDRVAILACAARPACSERVTCLLELCLTGCRRAAKPLLTRACRAVDATTWECEDATLPHDLRWVNFSRLELRHARLAGADLRGAALIESRLRGADLSRARLEKSLLAGADLTNANAPGARLEGAVLTGADLSASRLSGADLRADLSGVVLKDADLRAARFGDRLRGTDLSGADMTGAHLPFGVDLSDAHFADTVCPDGTRSSDHADTCAGHVAVAE